MEYHPFKPLIDENSEILILGTFPSIKSIESLLKKYPNIKLIAFTSKTAEKLFKKLNINFPTAYLPSPSPAYAKMKYEDKLKEYFSIITSNLNKGN
jgi:G:T/U-mismatch repair DNA glycosylase